VLVVEEKRSFVEDQLVCILYNIDASKRPSVIGKRYENGAPLLPNEGELTPTMVAAAVVARLRKLGHRSPVLEQRLARLETFDRAAERIGRATVQRTPYFCAGCPHNTSTRIPEGSRAMAGIGCHGMALSVPARRTATISHMGAEGVTWIGQAPFTGEQHVFQNLGDGTYTHSGLLALRAAAVAGVNITYKILYNDAVAMTGGQPAEGSFTVSQIAHQVAAEGTRRLAIVSDEPDKYPANYFPEGATVILWAAHAPERLAGRVSQFKRALLADAASDGGALFMSFRRVAGPWLSAVALLAASLAASSAESYPSRRIALTVSFPVGSATDAVTRRLAESIRDVTGRDRTRREQARRRRQSRSDIGPESGRGWIYGVRDDQLDTSSQRQSLQFDTL
jgi:hypothetical protein